MFIRVLKVKIYMIQEISCTGNPSERNLHVRSSITLFLKSLKFIVVLIGTLLSPCLNQGIKNNFATLNKRIYFKIANLLQRFFCINSEFVIYKKQKPAISLLQVQFLLNF